MSKIRHITVRNKPLEIVDGDDDQGVEVGPVIAIATKQGMDVTVCSDDMVIPNAEVYFYVKLVHPWNRPNGGQDFDEFVTDGDVFFIAWQSLGKNQLVFNQAISVMIKQAIEEFVLELTS